uniref:Truncated MAT127 n=1 Tax=Huntiella moniliformis TaxID=1580861 RepID=A0A1D9CT32_9PEZI|nr:truncated MAT127 [Huntiella moniliformis]
MDIDAVRHLQHRGSPVAKNQNCRCWRLSSLPSTPSRVKKECPSFILAY